LGVFTSLLGQMLKFVKDANVTRKFQFQERQDVRSRLVNYVVCAGDVSNRVESTEHGRNHWGVWTPQKNIGRTLNSVAFWWGLVGVTGCAKLGIRF